MSWPVIFHAERPAGRGAGLEWSRRSVGPEYIGALFPAPWYPPSQCSPHFRANVAATRPPLMLLVPAYWPDHPDSIVDRTPGGLRLGNQPWCIDAHPSNDPNGSWTVDCPWPLEEGQSVALTIAPSLNCEGSYQGFIQNGVITDDCEGRR